MRLCVAEPKGHSDKAIWNLVGRVLYTEGAEGWKKEAGCSGLLEGGGGVVGGGGGMGDGRVVRGMGAWGGL